MSSAMQKTQTDKISSKHRFCPFFHEKFALEGLFHYFLFHRVPFVRF